MSSIYNYKKEIMESNPKHQVIELSLHPKKWENLYNPYPDVKEVFENLSVQNGEYIITRNDVFNTKGKQRIIKAMIWAFAAQPRINNLKGVLANLNEIYTLMNQYEDKTLSKTDFEQICKDLDGFKGVGSTTYSVLLYFYKVKCEEDMAVAVTGHITPVFNHFDELKGFETKTYYEQMHQINEIARNLGVQADWVEYFLYRVDKGEVKL